MEILATRTPPQLQECLAVYKHGRSWTEGVAGAGTGSEGQSPPLWHLVQASPLGACLPKFCYLGLSPDFCPLPVSVSPGRQTDVIIKKRSND